MLGKPYKKRRGKRFLALLLTAVLTVSGAGLVPSSLAEASEATVSSGDAQEIDPGGAVLPEESLDDENQVSSGDEDTLVGEEAAPEEGEQVPAEEDAAPEEGEQAPAEEDLAPEEGEQVPAEEDVTPEEEQAPAEEDEVLGEDEVSPAAEEDVTTLAGGTTYVLEASALEAFDAGAKADGDMTTAGTNDFFTLIWRSNSRVDGSTSNFEDGYSTGMRINFQGSGASLEGGSIRFRTTTAATVKIWWTLGGADREMTILNSAGETVATTTDGTGAASGTRTISTIELEAGGTYYLGGAGANNYICKVEVTEHSEPITSGEKTYVLEASALEAFDAGAKADGDMTAAGTDDFFTLIWRSNSRVDGSTSNFEDGYSTGMRINFQGSGASLEGGSIRFTTTAAATVKIWWTLGGADREMTILNSAGEPVATTTDGTGAASGTRTISTIELEAGGTYYLGGAGANNYICKVEITEHSAPTTYVLEASALEAFDAGAKADGDMTAAGTDDFFTLIWRSNSRVDGSTSNFEDGYSTGMRINFQGSGASLEGGSIRFTTTAAATVKIWWTLGGADREMTILNSAGEPVATTTDGTGAASGTRTISTIELEAGGTYYLGGAGANNYICKVEVTTGGSSALPERGPWADVPAPVITNVALNAANDGQIDVTVAADVSYDGGDRITVTMTAPDGTQSQQSSSREATEHTVSFAPGDSGTYIFSAVATREGEEEVHNSAETESFDFIFPLTAPVIKGAYNDGNGTVTVEWSAVHEADSYNVTAGDKEQNVTGTSATFEGLPVGAEVTFTVAAVRGEEVGPESSTTITVTDKAEMRWAFSAFGNSTSTDTTKNSYSGSYNEGEVRVWSTGGSGKIQESSHDGISFYYTAIDPETTNFILEATGHVNTWTYSNGQEAFGLAALDRVGIYGPDTGPIYYNNSYMTAITRLSYSGVNMRQGVGAIEKSGTTPDNFSNPEGDGFTAKITTLEYSFQGQGGTHNLVGNATNQSAVTGNIDNLLTDFTLRLEKNNTGYFMTYIDPDGNEVTHKTYDPQNLTQLDDQVYIGFFAARNFDVTFTDISLTFSNPADDAPAEERPTEYVTPSYGFSDRGVSNSAEGELIYRGNVDGTITIVNDAGTQIHSGNVTANTNLFVPVTLKEGANEYTVTVTPDPDFHPDGLSYKLLTSYDPWTGTRTITYKADTRDVVYVSPDGTADAAGTKENPTTLAAAVQWAAPGQEIILLEGTYKLGSISINRGINGTADKMITLKADPEATNRPTLDFGGTGGGITIEGNYWHLYGFDVTGSTGNGIHVAGSYNIVERVITYSNRNTGLQISRQGNFDGIAEWPSYNLILNCSSYLNADPGYEDADGFAAKLTVGEGNVFDGCIAAYNADDGWDLFARGERIGTVTVKNSIAFKNGWILDENGKEINAGNGNGFKMGGSGYEGGHKLINSTAFANKANGITCNSCPDIVVENSISFDNGSANLALYSSITGQSTNFSVKGYISYGKSSASADSIRPTGTQTIDSLQGITNYYFDGTISANSKGEQVEDDWFEHLDTDTAINDREKGISRNEDGTINMNGYLVTKAFEDDGSDDNSGSGNNTSNANSGSNNENTQVDVDWNKVNIDVKTEQGLTEGNNLNVRVGGQLTVPGYVIGTLGDSKATIMMHTNSGVAFSLSGNEVTAAAKNGIDLTNSAGSITVPGDVLAQKLAGTLANKQISIKNEAEFGMNVNLHVSLGTQNAGRYANLYRFNKQTGQFEYAGSFQITKDGQAMFGLFRGGEYLVTVTVERPNEVVIGNRYTVRSGDTLSGIASRNRLRLSDVIRLNPQIHDKNRIYPGQVINLR